MDSVAVTLVLAFLIVGVAAFWVLFAFWWLRTTVLRPLQVELNHDDIMVMMEFYNFLQMLTFAMITIPYTLATSLYGFISSLRENVRLLVILIVLVSVSLIWLEYHDEILTIYIELWQCWARPIIDFFLLPVLNLIVIVYDSVIPCVNFYTNLHSFYYYGLPIILFKCAASQDIGNLWGYFANVFKAFFFDAGQFLSSNYLYSDWSIMNFLDALGKFIDTLVPIFTCFCSIVDFIYVYFSFWARLPSLHYFINYTWNVIIRLIQIPLVTIFYSPHRPSIVNVTINACGAVESLGDTVEDTIFLIIEMFWGVITGSTIGVLPVEIHTFLSCRWTHIFSNPICGIFKVANMTNELVLHPTELFACDGSGVAYLQFGFVFDEFRVAAKELGTLFYILSNPIQALVSQLLLSIIDLISFTMEWVIGNFFYFFFGGPLEPHFPLITDNQCNCPSSFCVFKFFRYYFPNYWLDPGKDVHLYFGDLKLAAEAAGSVIASITTIFVPIGCALEHALKILICVVEILFNLFSFFYTIITFEQDIDTCLRAVNVDILFNEVFYLAGCLGSLFRQFDGVPACPISPNDNHRNVVCSFGNLVEVALDVIIIAVQQIVHFFQDMITLLVQSPGPLLYLCIFGIHNPSDPLCVRIPDFSLAIEELDLAICYFTDTVANVLPITAILTLFNCQFPAPGPSADPNKPRDRPKPCARITTCLSTLICQLLQVFTIPAKMLNAFFVKTLKGKYFLGFTNFLEYAFDLILRTVGDLLKQFGLLLDCVLCAFSVSSSSPNCSDSIYQIFKDIADLLIALAKIFTTLLLNVVKLVLTLIVGLFSGDPVKAIVKFIIGFFVQVLGGLGTTVVNFLVQLFDGLGLGIIGSFIKLIWKGFCFILQSVTNAVIVFLKIISFGGLKVTLVEFCCSGGDCTPSGGVTKRGENGEMIRQQYGTINGTIYVNSDNWMSHVLEGSNITWKTSDECNRTIAVYATQNFTALEQLQIAEIFFCFMKLGWNNRDDNQTQVMPDTCDIMLSLTEVSDWSKLLPLEKATIMNCMSNRLIVEALRQGLGIQWFPQDWLTNSYRKWTWGAEMLIGYFIYWQYFSDVETATAVMLGNNYIEKWEQFGLNVTHYKKLKTPADIAAFRETHRLKDYFEWNNAKQYEAIQYTTIGFWNLAKYVVTSMENSTFAFTDNITDPTLYLDYDYTLENDLSGFASTVNGLLHQLLSGARNMSLYWSNPDNVKKREDAIEKIKSGTHGMYRSAVKQGKMMWAEWTNEQLSTYEIYTQQCKTKSINETIEFMYQYEESLHGLDASHGEKSYAFRFYRWWQNLNLTESFTAFPILNSRDPKYSCRSCEGHDPNFDHFERSRIFKHIKTEDATGFHTRAKEEVNRRRSEYSVNKKRGYINIQDPIYASHSPIFRHPPFTNETASNDFYRDPLVHQDSVFQRLRASYNFVAKGTPQSNRRVAILSSIYSSLKNQFFFELTKYNLNAYDREMEKEEGLRKEKLRLINERNVINAERVKFIDEDDKFEKVTKVDNRQLEANNVRLDNFINSLEAHFGSSFLSDPDNGVKMASKVNPLHCKNPLLDHPIGTLKQHVSLTDEKCLPSQYDHTFKPSNVLEIDPNDKEAVLLDKLSKVRLYMDMNKNKKDVELYEPFERARVRWETAQAAVQRAAKEHSSSLGKRKRSFDNMEQEVLVKRARTVRGRDVILHIDSFISLPCASNISGLCQDCYYLDQLSGRVFTAVEILLRYYTGGQYAASLNKSIALFSYLFDPNAYCIVGDSPSNSITFPNPHTSILAYIGDDTPNKKRFNDLANMTDSIISNGTATYQNSDLASQPLDMSSLTSITLYYWNQWFSPVLGILYNLLFVSSTGGDTLTYLVEWFILCDWFEGKDYLGDNKRFSIGESMLMYLVGFFALWIIVVWGMGLDLLSLITGTSLSIMIFFCTYLSITYNYSALCWPGLPVMLLDDVRYFIVYTLFTKCVWFFSGIITSHYTNDHCYTCEIASNVTMLNCWHDLGFKGPLSNIVFMLEFYAPQVIQLIRDTPSPLYILYQIPFINEQLNQFVGLNMEDPVIYARYMSCNYIITLLPDLTLLIVFLVVFAVFLFPVISTIASILWILIGLASKMLFIAFFMLRSIRSSSHRNAVALSNTDSYLPIEPVDPIMSPKKRSKKRKEEEEQEKTRILSSIQMKDRFTLGSNIQQSSNEERRIDGGGDTIIDHFNEQSSQLYGSSDSSSIRSRKKGTMMGDEVDSSLVPTYTKHKVLGTKHKQLRKGKISKLNYLRKLSNQGFSAMLNPSSGDEDHED